MAKITVGLDKNRALLFNFTAWEWLAEKYGSAQGAIQAFQAIATDRSSGTAIKALIDFVYAACIHEDPALDRRTISNALDFKNIGDIVTKIGEAIGNSLPTGTGAAATEGADPQ